MLKRSLAAALGLVLFLAPAASAQDFGRNKVQYDRFHFEVLQTPHFDVHFYAEERQSAQIAARLAERWYERLSKTLSHSFERRQPIVLYASHSHFAQTSIVPGSMPEGVGGFTDHLAGRVVLPFAAGLGETNHVLGHEIVHAFQRDILRKHGRSLATLPLWFAEGMAEYLSLEDLGTNTRMWLRDAVSAGRLPTLAQLDNPRWFPYRYGHALWAYLAEKYGERVVVQALTARASRGGAVARIERTTGANAQSLTTGWQEYMRRVAGDMGGPRLAPEVAARQGTLNLAPALSPDGRHLVFLSDSDGYSLDVFLADAKSGKVLRRLVSTATDPHFDSLQFIDSAGAWSPTGDRFALATVRGGRPVITIFAMPDGDVLEATAVDSVDQIYTPTWSPDGQRLAFTGLRGGVTDLYTISLADGAVTAITADAYSDLQPRWSPDGRRLAFTSDRFTSSLDGLTFGPYLLGLVDVESGAIEFLGGTGSGKSIDPQWCDEGSCVYFVSDTDGVSNVYRLDLDTRETARLTDVLAGVSGITSLSPSISLGAGGERLAFSVYAGNRYEIRVIDVAPVATAAEARVTVDVNSVATTRRVDEGIVPGAANSAAASSAFPARQYAPRLSVFDIGQPYMAAGGGAFGTYMRAGMSLSVGDLLGQQRVGIALQAGKNASDFAMEASYINRRNRWNWGVAGSLVPWVVSAFQETRPATAASGESVVLRDSNVDRQLHRQISGLLVYPFSRARRIETSMGIDSVAFNREVTTTTFSAANLERIDRATSERRIAQSATSLVSAAALVHDTALFGVTSPVLGERYRVGLTTSVGDLNAITGVADYRRYYMPISGITIAARVQHVARLGPSVSDPRLLPIVWAPRELVRGFNHDSTSVRASQVSSFNAEVRAPLAQLLGRASRRGALPIEVFAFSDVGRFSAPRSTGRAPTVSELWSAGAGARVNAAGFVFELNAVRPLLEMQRGWHFVANFRPGF